MGAPARGPTACVKSAAAPEHIGYRENKQFKHQGPAVNQPDNILGFNKMYENRKVTAVIVAAGSARRMGGIDKQYAELAGMPVLARSVAAFEEDPFVDDIIIVVRGGDEDRCRCEIVEKYGFKRVVAVIAGGAERQDSVRGALEIVCGGAVTEVSDGGGGSLAAAAGVSEVSDGSGGSLAAAAGVSEVSDGSGGSLAAAAGVSEVSDGSGGSLAAAAGVSEVSDGSGGSLAAAAGVSEVSDGSGGSLAAAAGVSEVSDGSGGSLAAAAGVSEVSDGSGGSLAAAAGVSEVSDGSGGSLAAAAGVSEVSDGSGGSLAAAAGVSEVSDGSGGSLAAAAGVSEVSDGSGGRNDGRGGLVLIHDGARPLVSRAVIDAVIEGCAARGAAIPAVPVKDTIKQITISDCGAVVNSTPERSSLRAVQTPQGFDSALLKRAYDACSPETAVTDDASLVEAISEPVYIVDGDEMNIKITTPSDLGRAEQLLKERSAEAHADNTIDNNIDAAKAAIVSLPRTGMGYDVHAFAENRKLILGGVDIPHDRGLLGHSDADVLIHAVMDALLGAAALGDIGKHFPDTDPRYKGISSLLLLGHVADLLHSHGWTIINIDATVIAQRPKIAPHIPQMKKNMAEVLKISESQINIKGTTTERLGFTGREEGIASQAIASIIRL